jgi:hypothetical protein
MANITKEERARREREALAAAQAAVGTTEPPTVILSNLGQLESKFWPGLMYPSDDPEPEQNHLLGVKDPVWAEWFQRQGGAK